MSPKQLHAASLIAANPKITAPALAAEAGVSLRTIFLWKANEEFQQEVVRLTGAWRKTVRTDGIADMEFRIHKMVDRHRRLCDIIEQRAVSEKMQGIPGGDTGLLTIDYKMRNMGGDAPAEEIPVYRVDAPLLKALAELETNIAIETGQDKKKAGDVPLQKVIETINQGRSRVAALKRMRENPAVVVEEPPAVDQAS